MHVANHHQGSELLETLRALPQEAYEGMLGHSGVMLRGLSTTPTSAEIFFEGHHDGGVPFYD